jgi:hypothetical protein
MVEAMTPHEIAEAVLQRSSDVAGVARACALAEIAGVEDGNAAPGAGEDERGIEAGDAGAAASRQ